MFSSMERLMTKRPSLPAIMVMAIAIAMSATAAHSQAPKWIKIGYAISLTGPGALGAEVTQLSDYRLWVEEVNAAGGLMLSSIGKRVPIKIIEYDDHSSVDDVMKAEERLISQDKVDFILPPWGTEFNLAVAPLLSRAGYPDLVVTSTSDRAPESIKRWPNSFWFLGTATGASKALIDTLAKLHAEGKVGDRLAMVSVADEFGIGLARAARRLLRKGGFKLVYDRSYPVDLHDMRPMVTEVKQLDPDVFLALSYPPDTMAITEQARALSFNPKVFYTAVGTAFPVYKQRFGSDVEGVMGLGGWDPDMPGSKDYLKRHIAMTGKEPDRFASPMTYASLQMLQQAIERVGKIDRAAVIKELQTGTFQTIVGPIKLKDNLYTKTWYVGQWQSGEYYGIAPATLPGARKIMFPKPAWHTERSTTGAAAPPH
jgi:branched-chain amino acid transport system substrate-binding protein